MCNHRILAHSENGYIVQCKNCNHYQLAFGTSVICLSAKQYVKFKTVMSSQYEYWQYNGFPNQKNVELPTFSSNTQFVLTFNELEKFKELIEEAEVLLEVDRILQSVSG